MRTSTGSVAAIDMYCEVSNAHKVTIKPPPHADYSGNVTFQLPPNNGTNGYVLTTNGSGITSWAEGSSNKTTEVLYENANTISTAYTITSGNNALSAGPITVATGGSVTVPTGSAWTVV